VQPKNVTFPTDAKLLHAAIKGHNRLAKKHGVWLRQSYLRLAKRAAMVAGRYAHAKQFKRNKRQLHILRTRLDRLVRDIRRKIEGKENIVAAFAWPRTHANHIRSQQAPARLEAVFLPCPEVECIGKGNVRTPYEFGVKVSIVTTNARAPKFRSRTMFPTRARSNASEMLLHIRSLAGYATDTHEPSFWKWQVFCAHVPLRDCGGLTAARRLWFLRPCATLPAVAP
jgi:hypothetical protein